MTLLMVTISWPGDAERGSETYGPFDNEDAQMAWVDECQEAADAGWRLLHGAEYLLHRVSPPFDASALWEQTDGMAVHHGG